MFAGAYRCLGVYALLALLLWPNVAPAAVGQLGYTIGQPAGDLEAAGFARVDSAPPIVYYEKQQRRRFACAEVHDYTVRLGVDQDTIRVIAWGLAEHTESTQGARLCAGMVMVLQDECARLDRLYGPDCLIEEWSSPNEDSSTNVEILRLRAGQEPESLGEFSQCPARTYCRDYFVDGCCVSLRWLSFVLTIVVTPVFDRLDPSLNPQALVSYAGPLSSYGKGLPTGREGYEVGQAVAGLAAGELFEDSAFPTPLYGLSAEGTFGFGSGQYYLLLLVENDVIWRIDCDFHPTTPYADGKGHYCRDWVALVLRDQRMLLDRESLPDCWIEEWYVDYSKGAVPVNGGTGYHSEATRVSRMYVRDYLFGEQWYSLRYVTCLNATVIYSTKARRDSPREHDSAVITYSGRLGDYGSGAQAEE